MANVLFIGDLHLGHSNIPRFRPQYTSEEEQYEDLYRKWHSKVTKRDVVYLMGDCCFTHKRLQDIKSWAGTKKLIVGNHDLERGITMQDVVNTFDSVHSLLKYKEFWLSHAPIHPDELRGKHNIHGHIHNHVIADSRYINVCVEQCDGVPVSLCEIRERMGEHGNN